MNKNSPDTNRISTVITTLKGILQKIPFGAVVGGGALLLSVVLVGYYILFPAWGDFHADCTDTILWAQAAYDGKALINFDFAYACYLPIGGQLLMLPFIPLFGVSTTTHTIGMMLFFLLFTAALLLLFRQMRLSWGGSALSTATVLLILSGSTKLREIFWGHVIYYSLGLLFLAVGLALTFRLLRCFEKTVFSEKKAAVYGVLLSVWCVLGAINQVEILTLFSVPLIGALIGERFFDFQNTLSRREKRGTLLTIAIVIAATVIGYLIGILITAGTNAGYANAYAGFSDPSKWYDNAARFFVHYVTLFGIEPVDGQPLTDTDGVLLLIKILASAAVLLTPVVATAIYRKIDTRPLRLLILSHWIVTALVMMGFVFGRLSMANWRLSPILGTSVIVTTAFCAWCLQKRTPYQRLLLIAMVPIAVTCAVNAVDIASLPPQQKQDEGLYTIVDTMKEQGLTYGYATFWNANALTVISDSDIRCRTIELTDNHSDYKKRLYQSNVHWYDDQEGEDDYFVLLNPDEYDHMKRANNPLITTADSETVIGDYHVLVFDDNIF